MSKDNGIKVDSRDADIEAKLINNETKKFANTNSGISEKNANKIEVMMSDDIDIEEVMRDMPLTDDITCGFWIFKGYFFQRFANQISYMCLYGIVGCIFTMTYAYFNGTISTIEKRFKIPSRNTGIISIGNDISQLIVSAGISYYAGKGHRPRWLAFGVFTVVVLCLLMALPQFLYGPGEEALSLTEEYGAMNDVNSTNESLLCMDRGDDDECKMGEGNFAPQVILFTGRFIAGIGWSLYFSLGVSYMDDNTDKSKTPALMSISYFLRVLGPAMGFFLSSICLRTYIAPRLHPLIGQNDPRWLGAWWMGWLVIAGLLTISGFFMGMFPKHLPRAVASRIVLSKRENIKGIQLEELMEKESTPSLKDMLNTFQSMINPTLICNNVSSAFYMIGFTMHMFNAKYIEIQFRKTAASSSFAGTIALVFSILGILVAGILISKYKPKARYMAAWNVVIGFLTTAGIFSYAFIGCPGNENSVVVNIHDSSSLTPSCNSNCYCDYVRYSPVCGEDGMTYISPCHAGCKKERAISARQNTYYYDCECIPGNKSAEVFRNSFNKDLVGNGLAPSEGPGTIGFRGGYATSGACPVVDCYYYFATYAAIMCFLHFIGASGNVTNLLVSVRCVPKNYKTAAMGFELMVMSLVAYIPSPIFFGWIFDNQCLVWGKTCLSTGNCWLYDSESLRYALNITAAIFIMIGSIFDVAVWYYVKDLKLFDEELEEEKDLHHE